MSQCRVRRAKGRLVHVGEDPASPQNPAPRPSFKIKELFNFTGVW